MAESGILNEPSGKSVAAQVPADAAAQGVSVTAKSHRKPLLIASLVLLALLALLNGLIHYSSRSSQRQHMLNALQNIPEDTDCLFLGNSLVEAGCDLDSFKAGWPSVGQSPKAVNLALGATSPVEHYLILKKALEQPL